MPESGFRLDEIMHLHINFHRLALTPFIKAKLKKQPRISLLHEVLEWFLDSVSEK